MLEYWVEHTSSELDYEAQLKETLVQNEVFARHNQLQQAEVGDNFEMPPAGMFRLHLAGEIVSATMFSHCRSALQPTAASLIVTVFCLQHVL